MPASPHTLDPYRLPATAVPHRYDVCLRPDLGAGTFAGWVEIEIELLEWTDRLVLNAIDLTIGACAVDGISAEWELADETERMFVTPARPLGKGFASIRIEFAGILNDLLRGFYRSTYIDEDGAEQVIATTQMQSTDCRRAFPCWDEPGFKAVFGITLEVEDGLTAISNGPEVERAVVDGRTIIRFADTMKMSSYLVAFIVGRLEMTDPVEVNGTPLRVVHVPGKRHLTDFGLDVGAFALRWFEEYYGIPYPGDKVDLVGLPDFAAGAMENLGCVTFRENVLLIDPDRSTQREQELVADVVSHELAHMWFGDLVTMKWWNGIWLNEAFATFMEIAACDAYRPDWQRWTSFGVARTAAFETDSLRSTRSVEYEVRSPADCEAMFDVLTYEKGGALLRMLEQYLGRERFREGVGHYLRTHSHANTETNDLWDAIEETSGSPVRRMMDSWIWQPGYPLVAADLVEGADGAMLRLDQRRFLFADPQPSEASGRTADDTGDDSVESQAWVVPVHVRQGTSTTVHLLESGGDAILVPIDTSEEPVVVNAGGHGFFRVAYDEALRGRLVGDALKALNTLERYTLVDDAGAATLAGRLSTTDLLDLLDRFGDERDQTVWQAIAVALRGISRLDEGESLDALAARVRTLVAPALADHGEPADGEDDLIGKLRGQLTTLLGGLGDDDATQRRCRAIFDMSADNPGAVDPELLAAATIVVASSGDEAIYERMVAGFADAATPQDQLRHLNALAEFDDAALILRTCEFAMSDRVKTQNAPFLLRLCIANRNHGPAAWRFVRENWDEANERFPSNSISRMIDSVQLLNTAELVADAHAFFAEHPIEQALKTQEQILERQRVNAALRARDQPALSTGS
ncbi:MAG: M1 family aminopeptidase [Acidimicrobiia bacterium]|nr:M1 family aminopeptidase [Acidimicrobiia bacterium]